MQINRALLESSEITKHFMTDRERDLKKALCKLLIDRGHRKYAERFWKLDFNIVNSKKYPKFTAAISFDEATVFISDGFLTGGQGIFNQLDVLLRHELAHNLMMHQIRLMHVFKRIHAKDPDEAYERIKYSSSLHAILNIIEDFEISNKRYTAADKAIVRKMQLNGRMISGMITEDHRDWENLSLEQMYDELSKELIRINSAIRSDPYWRPSIRTDSDGKQYYDAIEITSSGMASDANGNPDPDTVAFLKYRDYMSPSEIKAPIEVLMKSSSYKKWPETFKKLVADIYNAFKDLDSDADKQLILDVVKAISETSAQETFEILHPTTGDVVNTVYTPEDKMIAMDVLKNMAGNINYNPLKFKIKRKTNSQDYKDAWNNTMKQLDSSKFDDETLEKIKAAIANS